MEQDNVVATHALTLAELGISPTSVEETLPTYLGQCPID